MYQQYIRFMMKYTRLVLASNDTTTRFKVLQTMQVLHINSCYLFQGTNFRMTYLLLKSRYIETARYSHSPQVNNIIVNPSIIQKSASKKQIHTQIICKLVTSLKHNDLLYTKPPDIDSLAILRTTIFLMKFSQKDCV